MLHRLSQLAAAVCAIALLGSVTPSYRVAWGNETAPSPDQAPWNFVIFIADDQGENDLGCYGNPVVRTPNMDRLAAEGMKFTQAFLTISSCSPSRSSILTGR